MQKGSVVMITGCSSDKGIGYHAARLLARKGYTVVATVRDLDKAKELSTGLPDSVRISVEYLDLTDVGSIVTSVAGVLGTHQKIDVLVNNAGYGLLGAVEEVALEDVRAHFETNVFGTVRLVQEVAPAMRARRSGHIINVSTIFSQRVCIPGLGYYIGSKAALEKISEALAVELNPYNIRVTNFQPGAVMTELERKRGRRLEGADPFAGILDRAYEFVYQHTPKMISPDECASALCSAIEQEWRGPMFQANDAACQYVQHARPDAAGSDDFRELAEFFSAQQSGGPGPSR